MTFRVVKRRTTRKLLPLLRPQFPVPGDRLARGWAARTAQLICGPLARACPRRLSCPAVGMSLSMEAVHASTPWIGSPWHSRKGLPNGSVNSVSVPMPRQWYMVVTRSCGLTAPSIGYAARRSERP